jgi:hypothetical protein
MNMASLPTSTLLNVAGNDLGGMGRRIDAQQEVLVGRGADGPFSPKSFDEIIKNAEDLKLHINEKIAESVKNLARSEPEIKRSNNFQPQKKQETALGKKTSNQDKAPQSRGGMTN